MARATLPAHHAWTASLSEATARELCAALSANTQAIRAQYLDRWFSLPEAAEQVGLTVAELERLIESAGVPTIRPGRSRKISGASLTIIRMQAEARAANRPRFVPEPFSSRVAPAPEARGAG